MNPLIEVGNEVFIVKEGHAANGMILKVLEVQHYNLGDVILAMDPRDERQYLLPPDACHRVENRDAS